MQKTVSPRLSTIRMVEDVLKEADWYMTIPELKRLLPKRINHNTLRTIIEYLEESNKIIFSSKGITWIVNESPKMKELIKNARRVYPLQKD